MFVPFDAAGLSVISSAPRSDIRRLRIEAAMSRVRMARENWYSVMFGGYRFIDQSVFDGHAEAEAAARDTVVEADSELSRLLNEATAGAMADATA